MCYNLLFTLPAQISLPLTDKYVNARALLSFPKLYRLGRENAFYNGKILFHTTINAMWHGIVTSILLYFLLFKGMIVVDLGCEASRYMMGATLLMTILTTTSFKILLICNTWTKGFLGTVLFIPVSFIICLILHDYSFELLPPALRHSDAYYGLSMIIIKNPIFWFAQCLIPISCLLRDIGWKFWQRQFQPQDYHIVQDLARMKRKNKQMFGRKDVQHFIEN